MWQALGSYNLYTVTSIYGAVSLPFSILYNMHACNEILLFSFCISNKIGMI